jgi:hypothetical protein
MQTLNIDGTTYTLKDSRNLAAFTKLAQTKFRKRVYKQSERLFPTFQTTMSTHEYIDRYQMMNVVKHKKLVRFAYPIWLFVTVSGVVVYLMISPYYNF